MAPGSAGDRAVRCPLWNEQLGNQKLYRVEDLTLRPFRVDCSKNLHLAEDFERRERERRYWQRASGLTEFTPHRTLGDHQQWTPFEDEKEEDDTDER